MKLEHVQIAAPPGCEGDARHFYGEVLGLKEIPKPAPMQASGGVWFRVGAQELHIGVENDFAPARKAHPGLRVDEPDLDALAERLAAAGAPVDWDERYPGVRRFYTADPFGNRIEILA
jgi:catechol 2,3-dioxygenase-like lactoylglutathione lyase family enzyme